MIATDLKCPECGAALQYRPTGKFHRPWYGCSSYSRTGCRGAIGAHPDGTPLGVPANLATRQARIAAHALFDRLWKNGNSKQRASRRRRAYKALREYMGLTRDQCHIANFTEAQCATVAAFAGTRLVRREQEKRKRFTIDGSDGYAMTSHTVTLHGPTKGSSTQPFEYRVEPVP